ncbi:MAG: zf-HC2 domain-containing protein [Planctomycetes bacterium]|nr:zf-HC2 domain-containing protein [Planctomycetota bacterium]
MSDNRPTTDASCRSIRSRLGEALDHRLGSPDSKRVREHLLACKTCRGEYSMLTRLQRATRELPTERVTDDFRARLIERIESGEGARPDILQHPMSIAGRIKLFTSGALTAAALLVSAWLVYDGLRTPSNPQSMPIELASLAGPNDTLRPVDANGIGLRAVQKPRELFDGLRAQAPRLASQPPKRAMAQLREQSEALIQSIRFVNALDGTLFELPPDVRTSYVEAERTASAIVEEAQRSNDSRASVDRIVALLQHGPTLEPTIRVTIRLRSSEPVDIASMLQRHSKSMEELSQYLRFFNEHLLRQGDVVAPAAEIWGSPTLRLGNR